jgi:hypothetical protein
MSARSSGLFSLARRKKAARAMADLGVTQLTGLAMQQHFPNIPLASAIAAGAVISRLLDVLANKGLSREEILAILGEASEVSPQLLTNYNRCRSRD